MKVAKGGRCDLLRGRRSSQYRSSKLSWASKEPARLFSYEMFVKSYVFVFLYLHHGKHYVTASVYLIVSKINRKGALHSPCAFLVVFVLITHIGELP